MKNIFGSITYSKRSAILKMISKVMGEEKFDHGIRVGLFASNIIPFQELPQKVCMPKCGARRLIF